MAKVASLNVKPQTPGERGMPKRPVAEAAFRIEGVEGDYNVWRQTKRGGDPAMAVLVLTTDVLEDLKAEGWPVGTGHIGENVTVSGLKNIDLTPGDRLQLGEDVVVELHKLAEPCSSLHLLPYVGEQRSAEFIKTMLGRRGWYASVVREGTVRVGDAVVRQSPVSNLQSPAGGCRGHH